MALANKKILPRIPKLKKQQESPTDNVIFPVIPYNNAARLGTLNILVSVATYQEAGIHSFVSQISFARIPSDAMSAFIP